MLLKCLAFSYFPGYGFIFSNIRLYGDLLVATRWYSWTVTHQQSRKFLTQEFVLVQNTSQKKSWDPEHDKNMTPQYSITSWHRQFLFLVFVCSIIEFIWHLPSVVAFWINSFVVIKTTMGPRLRFLMYYSQRCLDLASNEEIFNKDIIIKQRNILCHHRSTKSSDRVKQARMILCRRSSELVWPKQSKKGTKTLGIVWIISTSYDLSFSFFPVDNQDKRFPAKRYFHQLELKYQKHENFEAWYDIRQIFKCTNLSYFPISSKAMKFCFATSFSSSAEHFEAFCDESIWTIFKSLFC